MQDSKDTAFFTLTEFCGSPKLSHDWIHPELRVPGGSRNVAVTSATWWPSQERTPARCFSDHAFSSSGPEHSWNLSSSPCSLVARHLALSPEKVCSGHLTVLGFHFPTCIMTELGRGVLLLSLPIPMPTSPPCSVYSLCVCVPVNFVGGYFQEDGHIPVNYTTEGNVSHCSRNDELTA